MIHRILLSLVAAGTIALGAGAETIRDFAAMPSPTSKMPFTVKIDSIDFRPDLTRVYGHIYGKPNTSARIDQFYIKPDARESQPAPIVEHEATDIDGFEFTHRFQWEEDGDIPVEIDFPPLVKVNTYYMRVAHPNGWYGLTVRRAGAAPIKKHRRR